MVAMLSLAGTVVGAVAAVGSAGLLTVLAALLWWHAVLWALVVVEGATGSDRGGRIRGGSAAVGWVAGAVVGWWGYLVVVLSPLGGL